VQHLLGDLFGVVDLLPPTSIRLCLVFTILLLWPKLSHIGHVYFGKEPFFKRLGLQCRCRTVYCRFLRWLLLFFTQLWHRRYVPPVLHCEVRILTQAGGSTSQTWAFRSCVITGTQQLVISFLLYWGAPTLSRVNGKISTSAPPSTTVIAGVAFPLAVLMCSIGALLFLGLPAYYRQKPGAIPSMYRALCRRNIVIVRLTHPFSFGYRF
jgi:hypothetical protein